MIRQLAYTNQVTEMRDFLIEQDDTVITWMVDQLQSEQQARSEEDTEDLFISV
ncbi:MAG: hypothetical protein KAR43_05510 [Deltaproteobacteria bacterium]|nr:hypothetical protein [Deltaproteobacteria bacterium]